MADLISVIDSIAGQADRIARTATTEAARSGPARELAAIADEACQLAKRSATVAKSLAHSLQLLHDGRFTFRTLDEARSLASMVASVFPDPMRVEVGICELLLNAVEHGNLEITYDEKTQLLASGRLEEEVAHRSMLPRYADRHAVVEIQRGATEIRLIVKDQGGGFDWRPYLDFSEERAPDSHGRGIATARLLCFTRLEYRGNGNEVVAVLDLSTASPLGPSPAASASR
jgi:anti-sigma regulatory factor (Ser/Thr protein kinase)